MIGAGVGFLVAAGVVLVVAGVLRPRLLESAEGSGAGFASAAARVARAATRGQKLKAGVSGRQGTLVGVAGAVGVLSFAVTRWPVAAVGAAAISYVIASTIAGSGAHNAAERAEGVAIWVETIRDLVEGGAGLETAVMMACKSAPDALVEELAELVLEVESGRAVRESVARASGRISNTTADIAVSVLVLTMGGQASRPAEVLGQIAAHAREEVARIGEIEAARASAGTTMTMVMALMGLGVGGFLLFGRSYLEPYGTPVGQLVLAGVLAVMLGAFMWMRSLIAIKEHSRIITPETML